MIKITIIGCGHGGQALAADLTQRGCQVTLYASKKHPGGFSAVAKKNGLECKGRIEGFVKIGTVTKNLQDAIADAQYIYIVLPSYAHEATFIEMLPHLQPGQTIITLAANFASLIYLRLLARMKKSGIDLIDIASLPYVCRADNQGTVEIISIKKLIAVASIPSAQIENHISILQPYFPCEMIPYQDVLSLGMNITSGITHPAITLLNAGRIGKDKEIFYFYRDGITVEIASLLEALDNERQQIGKQLGLEMYAYLDLMEQYYGIRYPTIYDFFRQSPAHNALPLCPSSLQERYITQDVAGLVVPWYCLGRLVNIDSLALGNIIHLASMLNKTNYLRTGTNLVQLDLHDKSIHELKQYIKLGHLPAEMQSHFDFYRPQKQNAYFGSVA